MWQILLIVALIFALMSLGYKPSWLPRVDHDEQKVEQIERDNQRDMQRHVKELDDVSHTFDNLEVGTAKCDQLMPLMFHPQPCPSRAASDELRQAITHSVQLIGTGSSARQGCEDALAWVQAAQRRLGCR